MRDLLTVQMRPAENVYLVRSLETGEEVVMFAQPIKLKGRECWSWRLNRVRLLRHNRRAA